MISRRNPIATRPTANTSHGITIRRLAAVTFASLARHILGFLVSPRRAGRGVRRVKPL